MELDLPKNSGLEMRKMSACYFPILAKQRCQAMTEVKKCPRCGGKMVRKNMEIETTDAGVRVWRIPGIEPVAYVCGKCGYIELYDTGRIKA